MVAREILRCAQDDHVGDERAPPNGGRAENEFFFAFFAPFAINPASRQRKRHERIRTLGPRLAPSPGRDADVLLAVDAVGAGRRVAPGREVVLPEELAGGFGVSVKALVL